MFLIKAKILDKTYNLLTIEGKTSSKTTIYQNINNSHAELDSASVKVRNNKTIVIFVQLQLKYRVFCN